MNGLSTELENILAAFRLIILNPAQINRFEIQSVLMETCATIASALKNSLKDLQFMGENTIERKFLNLF